MDKKTGNTTHREIQYSTINEEGVLASYDIYHEQQSSRAPEISTAFQTLQIYRANQLKEMLEKAGFEVLKQCEIDGSPFSDRKSERILTVAKKI